MNVLTRGTVFPAAVFRAMLLTALQSSACRSFFVVLGLQGNINLFPDDSWLNISPEQVDVLLNARMPNVEGPTSNGTNFDPSVITESIKRFMETVSGYEGAEFPE